MICQCGSNLVNETYKGTKKMMTCRACGRSWKVGEVKFNRTNLSEEEMEEITPIVIIEDGKEKEPEPEPEDRGEDVGDSYTRQLMDGEK